MAIKKEKVAWSGEASKALKKALGDDLQEIKKQVIAGVCELWRYECGGFIVTRLELGGVKKELVIVASGVSRGAEKLADWVRLADKGGWSIRIHSKRKGMSQFVKKQGFEVLETVYRRV